MTMIMQHQAPHNERKAFDRLCVIKTVIIIIIIIIIAKTDHQRQKKALRLHSATICTSQ